MAKKEFFEVEVGRNNNVWVDSVSMSLTDFKAQLPEYVAIGRPFRLSRACWLVQDRNVNTIKIMIKDAKGKLV